MAGSCFDSSTCSDTLLSPYCSETSWENGNLPFLEGDPLPPADSTTDVQATNAEEAEGPENRSEEAAVQKEEEGEKNEGREGGEQEEAIEEVELPPKRAIAAPGWARRQRTVSFEAANFLRTTRESLLASPDPLWQLAQLLSPKEAALVKAACKRRGPRRRLSTEKKLSRTTTNDRLRLAWRTLEEMLGYSGRTWVEDVDDPASCLIAKTLLTSEAYGVAEKLRLDKRLVSGLATMFTQRPKCLEKLVANLKLPLKPGIDSH